jgi:DNA helicase-2/ATP-dependent DNA helicase PcrA
MTASQSVAQALAPEDFARNQRRPIPARPTAAQKRGTEFHAWVERYFSRPALLDDDLEDFGARDNDTEAGLDELREAFLASPWADPAAGGYTLVATELPIDLPLESGLTSNTLDAVFTDAAGCHVIVDWKTGRPPADKASGQARALQLQLYRQALAGLLDIDPATVRAAFHYVLPGKTVWLE